MSDQRECGWNGCILPHDPSAHEASALVPLTINTFPPSCICGCLLTVHDATGKCHGSHGVSGFPCSCWCFREVGKPYRIYSEPDTGRIVELLERIEYNTRSR